MQGDLMQQEDVDAIVNTVNCVGIMGKGIALQFKKKWPENFKAYELACKLGEVRLGKMFIYDSGGLVKPNYIINFPTKKHWREAPRTRVDEQSRPGWLLLLRRRSSALQPVPNSTV